MDTPDSPWQTAFTLLLRPRLLLQGVVEYLLAWSFTRRWFNIALWYGPLILLVATSVGLISYGAALSRRSLVERYDEWITEEIPVALLATEENAAENAAESAAESAASATATAKPAATPEAGKQNVAVDKKDQPGAEVASTSQSPASSASDESKAAAEDGSVTSFGELLLRRLLQLENSNARITYLVAAQLGRKERFGQARQMMRRIAPEGGGGFVPAHAWLAADQLNSGKIKTAADKDRLEKDLTMAARWPNVNPALLGVLADLQASQGNVGPALSRLEDAANQTTNPDASLALNLRIADMAARFGQKQRYDRAAETIKKEIRAKMENNTAKSEDLVYLANLFLIDQTPEKARSVALLGLKKDPEHAMLKRVLSESYRLEYLLSIKEKDGQIQVNLGLLDAALKCDPSNPAVGAEVARLITAGQETNPELKAALESQLGGGQASALTHILLANRKLRDGELTAAIPHLESALYQAPGSPIVMNNLALALARTNPDDLKRSLELGTSAVASDPSNANFRDSLGEIRALNGDRLGAIESYETAIRLDPNNLGSRTKLAQLYRELGMTDMALVQEKEILKASEKAPQPVVTPAIEVPKTDIPSTDTPAADIPSTDIPSTDTPATDTPATETPTTETPAIDTPAADTPATDTPATDIPTNETPAADTP